MKRFVALIAFAALSACGGGDTPAEPDAATPESVPLRGACDADKDLGGFLVEVGDSGSGVSGKIEDSTQPVAIPELVLADGACRLLRRVNPFCDPGCVAGQVCTHAGACVAQPESQDVGEVTITGLVAEVTMSPVVPGNNYFATNLPHPVVEPGALVTLTSSAGFAGEMLLHGVGGQALAGLDAEWVVQAGTAITVNWTPPTGTVRTKVHTELNIDQHGLSPVTVVCEFDDTGTGTISAAAIDRLLATGVSGFPRGRITRRTEDSMAAATGCVSLAVERPKSMPVRVMAQ